MANKYLDLAGLQRLVNKIKELIPTRTSELDNDNGFITIEDIPDSTWESIQNKPDTFTPSEHNHTIGNITGLQNELNSKETPAGAQAKANQAEQNAKDYTDAGLADKVDKVSGKQLSTNDYTTIEKNKLAGIEENANNYIHPSSHSADMITETTTRKWVSPTEKDLWNSKAEVDQLHSHSNKSILDKITQTGSESSFDLSDFVTQDDLDDAGYGDMTKAVYDKNNDGKVDTSENAEKLGGQLPSYYAPKTYVDSELANKVDNSRVLTDVPINAKFTDTITTINGKTGAISKEDIVALGIPAQDTTYNAVTTTTDGLMVASDKVKLDGIESGANNYIHPSTSGNKHIPSGGSSGQFLKWQSDGTAIWDNVPGGLELGETSGTAYRGDRGKTAYDHSQSPHAPVDAGLIIP